MKRPNDNRKCPIDNGKCPNDNGKCPNDRKYARMPIKRLFLCLLALALCASAFAEAATPAAFLSARGLAVIDAAQLDSLGGDSSDLIFEGVDFSFAALGGGDEGQAAIAFFDGSSGGVALDVAAAFAGQPATIQSLGGIFADLCRSFVFDVCMFGGEDDYYVYVSDTAALEKLFAYNPDYVPVELFHDLGKFLQNFEEYAK